MPDNSDYGSFVATSNVFDIQNLDQIKKLDSPEFKNFLVRLRNAVNNMALSSNIKDSGYYVLEEFLNSQLFFKDPTLNSTTAKTATYRQVFRKVINFGALPNNTTKSVAHGLTIASTWTFTRIYGTASDTTGNSYIAIPYADTTGSGSVTITGTTDLSSVKWSDTSAPVSGSGSATITIDSISIDVDGTNVNITTTSDRTAYTACYVILEYIKE